MGVEPALQGKCLNIDHAFQEGVLFVNTLCMCICVLMRLKKKIYIFKIFVQRCPIMP